MKVYWTAEIYGFGKWIRRYGFYPKWLPLCIYAQHGAGYDELLPAKHELENDAIVQFYHNNKNVKEFKNLSQKRCYTIYSPFVFARRKLGININKNASGTIFFIAHSTPSIDDLKDVEIYHSEIKKIPDEFNPVSICLHIHDVNKGLDKKYEELGYKVVTAGDSLNYDFTERFYKILSCYKYAMSNLIGSYTYYAIEMGIPFTLWGSDPHYYNFNDRNIEPGHYRSVFETEHYKYAVKLFSSLSTEITNDQKNFVANGLGIEDGTSRLKMSLILYQSFLLWIWKKDNAKKFWDYLTIKIKSKIKSKYEYFKLQLRKFGLVTDFKIKINKKEKRLIKRFLPSSELNRIIKLPRYKPGNVIFFGNNLQFADNSSLISMIKEIYINANYKFNTNRNGSIIIDCGANIGLSIIYFKQLIPEAKIIAFEADPAIYYFLKRNIDSFKLDNIETFNKAVWIDESCVTFQSEGSWGGYLGEKVTKNTKSISVQGVDLNNVIKSEIEFLKMDIEGAEYDVIMHCKEKIIKYVRNLFFEWHSLSNKQQNLGEILSFFETNGYRYHIKEASPKISPFIDKRLSARMDSQLDCFLYRD